MADSQGSIAFPLWSCVSATSLEILAPGRREVWPPHAGRPGRASTLVAGMGGLVTREPETMSGLRARDVAMSVRPVS